ncbi:hypothetical protein DW047_04985 [Phocaeicola vulgatus]|uniref:Uncharacterized protein n=1 Tax=Phocaeicola vulgatus TaxID=821 RepID=A0A3E4WI36_PHOVU|nr:hypothetical protein DXC16_16150 [Phocaeicola vulgatus]RHJ80717.1 hypothetical protein DW105_01155 [Phocaeicola vulgatus]RHK84134.1 hypothetical protein DW047_04985 [Phocaeicola vulgatus]
MAYYWGKMFFFSYFFVFTWIQAGGAVFSGYKKRMYQTRIFFCFDTSSLSYDVRILFSSCAFRGHITFYVKTCHFIFPVCADSD